MTPASDELLSLDQAAGRREILPQTGLAAVWRGVRPAIELRGKAPGEAP